MNTTPRKIRAYVKLPVVPAGGEASRPITLRNVSLSGCLLVTDAELAVGDSFGFYVETSAGRPLPLTGTVVRRQAEPRGYGVYFKPPAGEARAELALLIAGADEPPEESA
ncbi:MAG TPA: PilZ domain-containing protein [Pyrinomonadaceae bacterium]|jgi:hypothetical protein